MPSSDSDSRRIGRRAVLTGAGAVALAGVGTAAGYRRYVGERDDTSRTRTLSIDEEFDVDDVDLEPAEEGERRSGTVSQRCDPDPDRWRSASHHANLTMIGAWNERYSLLGDPDADESGVFVQNSVVIEKAPERVDGSLLYGVRLHSDCDPVDGRLARVELERLANELAVDPAIEIASVLPSEPITADDGNCRLELVTGLPSGWVAGYEYNWHVNDGRFDAERTDDGVVASLAGGVSERTGIESVLELRTERPLSEFSEPFTWTVRGEAVRRGW